MKKDEPTRETVRTSITSSPSLKEVPTLRETPVLSPSRLTAHLAAMLMAVSKASGAEKGNET